MAILESGKREMRSSKNHLLSVLLTFGIFIFGVFSFVLLSTISESSTGHNKEHHSIQNVVTRAPLEQGIHYVNEESNDANQDVHEEKENDYNIKVGIGITLPDPQWTPPGPGRYPEYKDGTNIFESTPEILAESDAKARLRRDAIRNTMKHAWKGYKDCAWGKDEVIPHDCRGENVWGGMGTTLVDSLDTLWLMGMKDEFWEARDWVRDFLNHETVGVVSVFETTIRSLGGLLSAYDWSGDEAFLTKAEDLGRRLGKAFDAHPETGIPSGRVTLRQNKHKALRGRGTNIAEAGTLQLEFRYLAKTTGYDTRSERVFVELQKLQEQKGGLFPQMISTTNPVKFLSNSISFGAMGDSFYEYMLKLWLQSGKTEPMYRNMYDFAMDGLHNQLIQKTSEEGLTYIAAKVNNRLKHEMDHLACFMAGSLALGAYTHPDGLQSPKAQRDLETGKALAYTCYQSYAVQKSGIGPEVIYFNGGKKMGTGKASSYILRPETVESFFILNVLTGDPVYREWGWEVYQSIERFCKTEYAYGGIKHVDNNFGSPTNKMESFFLAETLKYLYLLFDPDTEIDILNKHVFNTEAHPMRRFDVMDQEATVKL